jgi:ribosomal protein S27E
MIAVNVTEDRIEWRDGRPYKVTVLPDGKTPDSRRGMMTMKSARAIAMGKKDRAVRCHDCGRTILKSQAVRAKLKQRRIHRCGECAQKLR